MTSAGLPLLTRSGHRAGWKAFVDLLKRIEKAKSKARSIVARYNDFGRLFDVLIAVKSKHDIHNGAVALRVMADLAMERLAEIERSGRAVS